MKQSGRTIGIILALLLTAVLSAPVHSDAAGKILIVGTAPAGSGAFPYMVAVTTLVNKEAKNFKLSPQESGGAVGNVRELVSNKLQLAGTSAMVNSRANRGVAPFKKKTPVRVLFTLFAQRFVYFGLKAKGVKSWPDLKGKQMTLGAPGGSTRIVGTMLAKLNGLNKANFRALYLRWAAMTDALRDGRAAGGYGLLYGPDMIPNAPTLEISSTLPVNVLTMDEKLVDKAIKMEPGLGKTMIPAGKLKGQTANVHTLTEFIQLGTLPNAITNEEAYLITKITMKNQKRLARFVKSARGYSNKTALMGVNASNIHPGAFRYFKEAGLMK